MLVLNTGIIRNIHMFSGLGESELEAILKISKVKNYSKGDIIFFDTEPYRGFYIVINGLVKVYKISKDGKEHILHLIGPNDSFAEVPLFEKYEEIISESMKYPANAMALEEPTEVIMISAEPFVALLENDSKLCLKMLSGFAKRLRFLNQHIEDIALKDVTKRVAGFLLAEYSANARQSKDLKPYIKLNISKNDLAAYLGTIIETLSRTFKKMQDDDLIEVEGKKIQIKNLEGLKKHAF